MLRTYKSPLRSIGMNSPLSMSSNQPHPLSRYERNPMTAAFDKLSNGVCTSAMVEWMVVWTGELITRYVPRENGRTAFESTTGHRCKQPAFIFGKKVMFRIAPDKSHRMKANSDWLLGNSIGIESRASEYLIINATGLYKCRSMKRMSRDKAFNSDDILKSDLGIEVYVDKGAKTSVESHQGELAQGGAPADRAFAPRRARLLPEAFVNSGFTSGCRGCAWLQDRVGSRVAHSNECRERMEKLMTETEAGKERLQKAQDRQDYWVSEQVKQSDVSHAAKDDAMVEEEVIDIKGAPAADTSQRVDGTLEQRLEGDISDIEVDIEYSEQMSGSPPRGTMISNSGGHSVEFSVDDATVEEPDDHWFDDGGVDGEPDDSIVRSHKRTRSAKTNTSQMSGRTPELEDKKHRSSARGSDEPAPPTTTSITSSSCSGPTISRPIFPP